MIAKFADIPVNDAVREALEAVVRKHLPFTKDQVVDETLKQHNIRMQVRVIGGEFAGWHWDKAIETHILTVISFELHRRNKDGVRLFQCWPGGGGKWLWEPFVAFDLAKLETLFASAVSRGRQAEMAQERISLWITALKGRGKGTIGDVYESVVHELKVVAR